MSTIPKGANFQSKDVPSGIEREALTFVAEDGGVSRGLLYRPAGRRPKTGVHVMHPKTDQTHNYNILPLVAAGYAVLGRAGRWVGNDIQTIHEKVLLDVAAGVKHLRAQGCERVILLGNSGGGTLAAFYQSQASTPPPGRLTDTPAGDAFDLNRFDMPAADGIVFVAAHPGEGACLRKWLDPSVTDESDPMSLDPSLDMYSFENGFRVPPESSRFSTEFLARWHVAREARAARLDAIARERIAKRREAARRAKELAARGSRGLELQLAEREAAQIGHMLVYRGLADPAWVDTSIEPDERDVCAFNNEERPDLGNWGPSHAPILTPEAYLSTWSGLSSRANTLENLKRVAVPLLVVHYRGDGTTRLSEVRGWADASPSKDKTLTIIPGADHYGFRLLGPHRRGERVTDGTDAAVEWMKGRFPA